MLTEAHITEAQKLQFREQGYFIVPQLADASMIDPLRASIDQYVEKNEAEMKRRNQTEGMSRANEISFTVHLAEQNSTIMNFVLRDDMLQVGTALIAPELCLYWDQAVYKQPEARRDFPWHQDNGYGGVEPQEYLTCWLALDDATISNGCIWVIPGSHKQGVLKHEDTPIGKQVYFGTDQGTPVELKKGGIVFFSSLLFHRSGPNVSDTVRKAYIVQYAPTTVRDSVSGQPLNWRVVTHAGQHA